ncbi:hypothetical protein D3C71_1503120 [compost metagenome]
MPAAGRHHRTLRSKLSAQDPEPHLRPRTIGGQRGQRVLTDFIKVALEQSRAFSAGNPAVIQQPIHCRFIAQCTQLQANAALGIRGACEGGAVVKPFDMQGPTTLAPIVAAVR